LEIKKFQAIQLPSMNSLLTAKSLGLGNCSAVKGEGKSLIPQECQTIPVEVTAKQTSSDLSQGHTSATTRKPGPL